MANTNAETITLPGNETIDSKPPNDKPVDQKPPNDKSITQEIIKTGISNGSLQIVCQVEISTDGSAIVTLYKERERKKKEEAK